MFRAMWTAAAGMTAQQQNLDIISNNMANVDTVGYKQLQPVFDRVPPLSPDAYATININSNHILQRTYNAIAYIESVSYTHLTLPTNREV